MTIKQTTRRGFICAGGAAACAAAISGARTESVEIRNDAPDSPSGEKRGSQRLSVERLQKWEALGFGMFIHFGMSTFDGDEYSRGMSPAALYAPDKLDVDQWVGVARDSGMKYAVLTAKHVAGHCLWPSRHTDYTVAQSGNTTNVVEKFVDSCRRRGVLPGLYYCCWDNHNRFGSKTPTDGGGSWGGMNSFPRKHTPREKLSSFTTSLYQNFQTAQLTELLTQYGPIAELWIDIPGVLGRGYREFLYRQVAKLQPEIVFLTNSSCNSAEKYVVEYAWPSDLMAFERSPPAPSGYTKWRTIEGREHYLPAEVCDTIGKRWFFAADDRPRPEKELLELHQTCRRRGANLLLNVPPDRHGLIPEYFIASLARLAKNANL
jgi:alpha-L-fucosidase